MIYEGLITVLAAVFGLLTGSFLNVVIYRLPLGKSVVSPRSFCPGCGRTIKWYENVPVVSYLLLRGRCHGCGSRIPFRYPVVELLGMTHAVIAIRFFGAGLDAAFAFIFLMALTAITFIDWDHRIIPDQISLSFIFVGLAWSAASPRLDVIDSLTGILAGGGGLWLIGFLYRVLRDTEGMGGGDIKLMAMIGAFLGLKLILPVIVIASFFGSIYGVYLIRRGGDGKSSVAFGSFLAPAAAVCLLFGPFLLSWYFSMF
ncbi:MAG TPA: prepilin peptidase [Candidatus Krumholzibacterium sp.]|nr:prepilin peptidase [Candidatus Krumholzibacterium sp.]